MSPDFRRQNKKSSSQKKLASSLPPLFNRPQTDTCYYTPPLASFRTLRILRDAVGDNCLSYLDQKDCSYIYRSNHIDIEISPFKLKIVSKFRKLQKVFHLVNICLNSHYFCIRKNQIMCFSSVMRSFATGVPLFA